jgi:hypothetical protein
VRVSVIIQQSAPHLVHVSDELALIQLAEQAHSIIS